MTDPTKPDLQAPTLRHFIDALPGAWRVTVHTKNALGHDDVATFGAVSLLEVLRADLAAPVSQTRAADKDVQFAVQFLESDAEQLSYVLDNQDDNALKIARRLETTVKRLAREAGYALSPAPDSKEQALTELSREGQKWDADSKGIPSEDGHPMFREGE